ncbi:MAG: DUF89 family protein [Planctomycetes bacterium]|nr:DUF89 family protein [Planctomycetota bacterium]
MHIHRKLKKLAANDDPYRVQKKIMTDFALALLPKFRKKVDESDHPFLAALKLSIAANIIDLGAKSGLTEKEVLSSMDNALNVPLSGNAGQFEAECQKAHTIMILADNAGEIVFDTLLIEQLSTADVTVVVRGGPIINDATKDDAINSGLAGKVRLMDNGVDAPGTILSLCSDSFRELFNNVDLVISKGQGNFESLLDTPRPVWFLFKVKCMVTANATGEPVGSHMVFKK